MITKFQIFEKINIGEPIPDDYVICGPMGRVNANKFPNIDALNSYITTHIGRVANMYENNRANKGCVIEYNFDTIPVELIDDYFHLWRGSDHPNFYRTELDDIQYWSNNKEDLESILKGKQFDL